MVTAGNRGLILAMVVVGTAIIAALLLAVVELRSPPAPAPVEQVPAALAAFEADAAQAQRQVDGLTADLKRMTEAQRNLARTLSDPGPEPAWYHPIDHWAWAERKAIHNRTLAALATAQADLLAVQQRLDDARRQFGERQRLAELARAAWSRPKADEIPGPVRESMRWIWNAILRPLLHWLLVVTLLLFALNRFLRLVLIQGWLGEERL